MAQPTRILIVDDEAAQMRALCNTLRDHGYQTAGFTDGQAALDELRGAKFELLVADLSMPGIDGIMLLQAAKIIDPDLVGIIMTGEGTIATAVEAMKAGALDFILKPFKLSVIVPVLERALAVRSLRLENAGLERRVRERTAELEAANRELEAFSSSVAHDLRGPLAVVVGYTEALIEDYREVLPAEANDLVDAIMTSAERMVLLTDGLLRLSRLGRQPLSKHPVDISAVVGEALEELRKENAGRDLDIRVGDLPESIGDRALLKQVITNLLSNAFKFTRGRAQPLVDVACRRQPGEKIYSIRDNGAGFDMRKATELFGAFRRFHDAEQYEGTGIGLSIASRIIQRHGGRIWAESEPDRGATFHFSLPE